MKKINFSIEVNASKERVWATLWEDVNILKLNVHNAAEWVTLGEIGRCEFMPAD